jgi:hypothetical protein
VSESFGIRQIVNGHELDVFVFVSGPKNQPADSSKTIDGYFHGHIYLLVFHY